jgi:hypothetical protein
MLLDHLGSFNLQVQVQVVNNQNVQWNSGDYELVVMTMVSGVMCLERGTAARTLIY